MRARYLILLLVFVAWIFLHARHAASDVPQQTPPAKSSRSFSPRDLSGVWFISEYHQNILPNEDPPFQPWAAALYKKRDYEKSHADPDKGPDPTPRCIPPGIPREMIQPFPWEIVMARDRIVMIFEYQSLVRQIFIDGRGHPADLDPTYMGNSVGKWEGDTLVVDTNNYTDNTWMFAEGRVSIHSDALHIVERYHRVDMNTLEIEATIEDPKVLTGPWKAPKATLVLAPFDMVMSLPCSGVETQSLMDAAAKQKPK